MSSSDLASRGDQRAMGMQWYIIHTYSGFEKKVKESLESRVAAFSLQDKIGRVLIPTEEVVEMRGGKKVVSNRMSYPGYVLVEMDLDENTWHTVRSTPRVTGFVGSATSPSPLTEAEVDGIINRVHTPQDRPKPKVIEAGTWQRRFRPPSSCNCPQAKPLRRRRSAPRSARMA